MNERRYTEQEVAAIFERATEAPSTDQRPQRGGDADGMTLTELQRIGREVGIAPELVARAAQALDLPAAAPARRLFGFPIGVARTVDLGRRLSDDEWERLVVDLRETFDARGRVQQDGALRQWTNGNLQALLEPSASGQRLRLRTVNGRALTFVTMGGALFATAAGVTMLAALGRGIDAGLLSSVSTLALAGAALWAVGLVRLPAWARRRTQQMDEIANRLLANDEPRG